MHRRNMLWGALSTIGALFAACRGRCILGDDMGLGKTVQTLAAAAVSAFRKVVFIVAAHRGRDSRDVVPPA